VTTEPPSDPGAPSATGPAAERPSYKGAPLDPERGPGLGCFRFQLVVLLVLLVVTPIGVVNAWPAWLTTLLLGLTLVLTLFAGQTIIFLLRLVAADRRSRRRPLRHGSSPTVGDLGAIPAQRDGEAGAGGEGDDPGSPASPPAPGVRQ
jgi:hypothetical protein